MADRQETTGGHKFSTFGGVFTPSILTILGAIMFLRAGFVVGEAGILRALAILLIATAITYLTALSISAIATNMQVRGGGAYFLISRVVGPEMGGAIGIVLFIAQALSVPFYILGFSEALVAAVPALQPHFLIIALSSATVLFALAYVGAIWSIRVQYYVMAALGISIIAFMGGALLLFSPETFNANMGTGFTLLPGEEGMAGGHYSFWVIFAIYFPAVTGILAGVNMSGDLRNPARSIPKGTLLAITAGLAVYLAQIILMGGAFSRADLISQPFEILKDNALFGLGFLVVVGVFAATLSSALGSYLGAPRIMQAVARDRLLSVLRPFSAGSGAGDEPRSALILTYMITLLVLIWAGQMPGGGGFNLVAALITMFFMYTYGMLNFSAFMEAFSNNPSFRPRFRAFHWVTALLGTIGCAIAAVLIDLIPAVIAVLVIGALFWYLRNRELSTAFGDARRGFIYASVRKNLLRLSSMEEDSKNWRPTVLVFSGNPSTREALVAYAVWLESGRGIVQLVNVIKAPMEQCHAHYTRALNQLETYCKRELIQAFPLVLVSDDVNQGITSVLQTAGVGPIRPNLALFGWHSGSEGGLVVHLRQAAKLGMSLVVIRGKELPAAEGRKRIDVYWRGRANGPSLILLAHLLTRNWEWSRSHIRLLRVVEREEGKQPARAALQEIVDRARIDAEIVVVASGEPFAKVLRENSGDATCIFLGFIIPEQGQEAHWLEYTERLLTGMPSTILVHNTHEENLLI